MISAVVTGFCDSQEFPERSLPFKIGALAVPSKTPSMPKLTKRAVDAAMPDPERERWLYDEDLKGFALRVSRTGVKTYVVQYRAGRGRTAPKRTMTLGKHGALTPDQARQDAKKVLADVTRGLDPAAARAADKIADTLADLIAAYLEDITKTKKKKTVSQYDDLLTRVLKPVLGKRKAAKVLPAEVAKIHRDLSDKPFLANRTIAVLSAMYGWAAKRQIVPPGTNPAKSIERYREDGRQRFLSDGELDRLGKALVDTSRFGPYPAAAIRLLILTGARLGEILNLRWDQVDLARGLLLLPDSKTGQKAVVLNAPAMQVLAELPRGGAFVILGADPEKPRADLNKSWKFIRKAALLDGLRIHDLRHSHASVGAGLGLSLPVIGAILGHTQAATTQRYAHLANDPVREASERIGAAIAKGLGLVTEDNDDCVALIPKQSSL